LSSIPNGATIDKIAFQIEAPSNGTFNVNNQEVWIAQHDTATEFPLNMRVNGTSATDTTWNNNFINYSKVYNGSTLGFTKQGGEPNIVWRDLLFTTGYSWVANKPFCIFWLNGDGNYKGGTSSYPRGKGDNLSGSQPRYYALDFQDNTPFTATTFVNYDLSFRPNIKIFYS
jgi:archaellin